MVEDRIEVVVVVGERKSLMGSGLLDMFGKWSGERGYRIINNEYCGCMCSACPMLE